MEAVVGGRNARHASSGSLDFELQEKEMSLSDRLKVFKSSQFDPDSYLTSKCHNMTEKEIKHLCIYLKDLRKASAEEMRKSVYANYPAFIRTAKEISALEGQLLSMRNLLSAQAAVVHGLADGARADPISSRADGSREEDISDDKNKELTRIENWLGEFMEKLEVLLAEKRVEEALAALDEAESVAEEANERRTLTPTVLQAAISGLRRKLADQLVDAASQPSTRGAELRSVVLALGQLGDGPQAHSLLLNGHHQKLQFGMQNLRPPGGSKRAGCIAGLSQLFFSAIAQAASDSLTIFGEETSYASELVTWAVQETEKFALLVKRQYVAVASAAGNLRGATDCVRVCVSHCSLLEACGLALSPVLLKHFKPCVEQGMNSNLKRIEGTMMALAADENWSLTSPLGGARISNGVSASQLKLTSSAHKFNSMIQELFEDVETLETMQLGNPSLDGVLQVFNAYVNMMINALPGSMHETNHEASGSPNVRQAVTEAQQLALLANTLMLADELIPRATSKLIPSAQVGRREDELGRKGSSDRLNRISEQKEWKRRLQKSVEMLRDSFCRQHALELLFTEDGDVRLSARMYTKLDGYAEEPEWFPSGIFQELFVKLTQIASVAFDTFIGRERFATMLLMRLTETVILWLSNDQAFWEEIEQGPKPLGPLGLQQFYLDMEFVILFSSQGRYLSRNLQQVAKTVIARAIDAVTATGVEPYSTLPEEEWFAEVAQIAIKMLMGKASFGRGDHRDAFSPSSVAETPVS